MKILWLKTELLHPVDKGGKIRTYNMLKELKRDHHITYLSLSDEPDTEAEQKATEYCHELVSIPHHQHEKFSPGFYAELAVNFVSRVPYAIKKYESSAMRREIVRRANSGSVDVVICDFLAPAINVPRKLPCPSILFQHNVEAMIWKRHYEVQTHSIKKGFLREQWRKMVRIEGELCRQFDCVIAVSAEDRDQIREEYSVASVFDVPTGVDVEFFAPTNREKVNPHNVVFTGSMDWLPNEDAIRFYTEQILPIIRKRVPDATITVVGRNPFPALIEMSKRDPSIVVTGRVDDVRPFMESAAAYVVPLRIGGGTRLKIFEAMAMEKAIVSTRIGAEGLPVMNGKELILADTPEAFASSVIELLLDQEAARKLGTEAAKTVRARFGWNGVAKRFADICEKAVTDYRSRPQAGVDLKRHQQPAA